MDAVLFLCWDKELFKLFERKPDVFNAFALEVDETSFSGGFFAMSTAALFVFRFGYIISMKGQIMVLRINFSVGVDDLVQLRVLTFPNQNWLRVERRQDFFTGSLF